MKIEREADGRGGKERRRERRTEGELRNGWTKGEREIAGERVRGGTPYHLPWPPPTPPPTHPLRTFLLPTFPARVTARISIGRAVPPSPPAAGGRAVTAAGGASGGGGSGRPSPRRKVEIPCNSNNRNSNNRNSNNRNSKNRNSNNSNSNNRNSNIRNSKNR